MAQSLVDETKQLP
ncbi:unnamed protein product, partial [Rotaria sp. Silwood2]